MPPFWGYLVFGLRSHNHEAGCPEQVWFEPAGRAVRSFWLSNSWLVGCILAEQACDNLQTVSGLQKLLTGLLLFE